ncbi:MAG TPA: DUF433 domain-containing protein [Anaerolineae bacterium]|nr:DUF433 domain-containing protein [Anaerolineae bacterium]
MNDRIVVDPDILLGVPHIRGIEVPVWTVVEMVNAGLTTEEIIAAYEGLTEEDIEAAMKYHEEHGD